MYFENYNLKREDDAQHDCHACSIWLLPTIIRVNGELGPALPTSKNCGTWNSMVTACMQHGRWKLKMISILQADVNSRISRLTLVKLQIPATNLIFLQLSPFLVLMGQ